tara:strand:- start:667 stop:1101 length:435 start_codon:yes stop_codon:yes gene_type:complete
MSNATHLKSLGSNKTRYKYDEPDSTLLERFENEHPHSHYRVDIEAPEFTSLCPKTGQPDYATIKISYIPNIFCVESKSLKLYLGSFRMHGEFHEDCVSRIMLDLIDLLDPKYIEVIGLFKPRGGITFTPVAEWYHPNYEVLKNI